MKPRRSLTDTLLQFCGVLFLLAVLGLAVLALTHERRSDELCATSASAGC